VRKAAIIGQVVEEWVLGFGIGVVGLNFGKRFAPLLDAHPLCDEVVLCDLREHKIRKAAGQFSIEGRTARAGPGAGRPSSWFRPWHAATVRKWSRARLSHARFAA
jgi:hypothetical protein